jgi:hypothetical protein
VTFTSTITLKYGGGVSPLYSVIFTLPLLIHPPVEMYQKQGEYNPEFTPSGSGIITL